MRCLQSTQRCRHALDRSDDKFDCILKLTTTYQLASQPFLFSWRFRFGHRRHRSLVDFLFLLFVFNVFFFLYFEKKLNSSRSSLFVKLIFMATTNPANDEQPFVRPTNWSLVVRDCIFFFVCFLLLFFFGVLFSQIINKIRTAPTNIYNKLLKKNLFHH